MKNKAAAPVQITAEQLLREAKERQLEFVPPVSNNFLFLFLYITFLPCQWCLSFVTYLIELGGCFKCLYFYLDRSKHVCMLINVIYAHIHMQCMSIQ